jgi:dolichyl-phosphate beta-glucosyltransferase
MGELEISVVIPAYNEAGAIESTVREIVAYLSGAGLSHEVIVVDDGSTDATASVVESMACDIPVLRLLRHEPNRGKGYAVRAGVLASRGRMVLFTDADNSTRIDELPALISAIEGGCGVAVGSRAAPGAVRTVHQPAYRELGGKVLNLFIQLFAVSGIRDTQCGFKLFTREAARAIFAVCIIDRFSFDVEVLYLAKRFGYKVAELPVLWEHHGGSRVNPVRDGLKMLADIARIRLHDYSSNRSQNKK